MTTVLSPLLLVVLVLIPPLTKAQRNVVPCNGNDCPPERSLCQYSSAYTTCFCPENTWGQGLPCNNTCGGEITDCEGVITTPNYPNKYPYVAICTWRFQAPAGFQATLTFNDFELEGGSDCPSDAVEINGAVSCGTNTPPATSAQSIELTFFANAQFEYRGFNVTYTVGDPNQCDPDPCQNGGTCLDGCFSFTCVCPTGFSGSLCEENINECQSNPCQNGATCRDDVNSYTCVCAAGFSGTLCEENTNVCQSNPCQNGATCRDDVNSYTCVCASGFNGTLCEATTYSLTYCIARGVSTLALLVPPAVNLTLTGSAGSTGTVTLTLRPLDGACARVTLTLNYFGNIQTALVTPTHISGSQLITVWNPLYFQLAVSSGTGQWCRFPYSVWYWGAQTRTLAAYC